MRGRSGWAVAGFVLAIAATSGAASNSDVRACRQDCQATYQDAITDPSECFNCATVACDPSCDGQLSDAVDGQDSCLTCLMGEDAGGCSSNMTLNPAGQSFFQICTNRCASPAPGVCALNLTCVRTCREQLFFHQQFCKRRFQNQVRAVCRQVACGADVNYFRTAKQQLRQCKRACKTNPGAAVARVTPQVETATAVPLQSSGAPAGCNCQQRCIRGVVGNCFNQCQNACRGDQDALNLCQRACTNAQCAAVAAACAVDAERPSASYAACCSQCSASGACDNDLGGIGSDNPICTPTTTTTTTSTTSSSTSSTGVTTTTFAGQTTSTTTTTFAGQTTTTTFPGQVMSITTTTTIPL
jgi:hypothetical protein